jgi:hypothetical protein
MVVTNVGHTSLSSHASATNALRGTNFGPSPAIGPCSTRRRFTTELSLPLMAIAFDVALRGPHTNARPLEAINETGAALATPCGLSARRGL